MSLGMGAERAQSRMAAAFAALERAGVRFSLRKGDGWHVPLPPGGEVDIWLSPESVRLADRTLAGAGFYQLEAAGAPNHRFYLGFEAGRWLKIDAKLGGPPERGFLPASPGVGSAVRRLTAALEARRPLSLRRLGPVVALLGPDGAGKGSILAALEQEIPVALKVSYHGWRPRRPPRQTATGESSAPAVSALRENAFVIYQALRAWRRLLPNYLAAWRGVIVLLDRHPVDVLAIQPRQNPLARRLERFVFGHLVPKPDVMVLLDAPGAVLFARKGEQTPELLETWRRRYMETLGPKGAVIVSTAGPLEQSAAQVSEVVFSALAARRRW